MKGLLALLLSLVCVVYVMGQTCPASNDFIIYNGNTPELTISSTTGDVLLCGNQNLCTYLSNANTWTAQAGSPNGIYKTLAGSVFAQGTGSGAPTYDGLSPAQVTQAGNKFFFYGKKGAIRAGSQSGASSSFSDANIGTASAAFGADTTASGSASTAFGYQSTATGLESTAFGYQSISTGSESTAFGIMTTASLPASTAFGRSSQASGIAATSFGQSTTASGTYSTAFGNATTSSGFGSTSFGTNTTASNGTATAFGRNSKASGGESTAFGIDANTANTTASALLTPLLPNYPGAPDTTQIPVYTGPQATGEASTSFGGSTYASGLFSTSWGFGAYAEGVGSTAFGTQGQAQGYDSVTWGLRSYARGAYSTAFGVLTTAQGDRSTSFGYETSAQFADSTAFGYGTVAQGLESTAMGVNTYAKVYSELVVGTCNTEAPDATNVQSAFNPSLTAFTVGIGQPQGFGCNSESDAFTVFRNGDVVINRDIYFNYGADPFVQTPNGPSGCGCISASGMCAYGCTPYDSTPNPNGKRDVEAGSLRAEIDELKREVAELKKLIKA